MFSFFEPKRLLEVTHRLAGNGLADKSSCHVLAQWQRKDFSRNSSYPLVSGSAEGTIRRSVAYRQPVSENRMQESPKGRCIRAVGIFANVPALGACGGLLAPKLNRNTTLNEPQQ